DDSDGVTDAGVVGLVVDVVALVPLDGLAVQAVGRAALDRHDDRLVLGVGHDDTATLLACSALGGLGHVGHSWLSARAAAISRSRWTVRMRAISRLTALMRRGSSSWPVTIWKRRLNSSSLFSASIWASSSSAISRSSDAVFIRHPPHARRTW